MRMFNPHKNSTLYVTLFAQQSVPALCVYVTPGTYWVEVEKMLLKLIPCCRLTNAEDGKPKSRDDQKQLKGAAFVGSFTSTLRLLFCRHLFFHKWNVWQRLMGAKIDVGAPQWSNKNKEKPAVWCYRPYLLLATWQQHIAVRGRWHQIKATVTGFLYHHQSHVLFCYWLFSLSIRASI